MGGSELDNAVEADSDESISCSDLAVKPLLKENASIDGTEGVAEG